MEQHKNKVIKISELKLFELNINRSILFFRFVGVVHFLLLFLDMYNGFSGIWKVDKLQYYIFFLHLISIPVLFLFCQYLKNRLETSPINKNDHKKLIGISVLLFFPIIMTYHYVEISTSLSGSAVVIYILGYGLCLNLNTFLRNCMSFYFLFLYFSVPIILGVNYSDNAYLFMIGIGLGPLFYLLSITLNRSEVIRFINEETVELKNIELKKLNQELSKANHYIQTINQTLESSNRDLGNFASIAAHDIKAPLRTIGSFSKLLTRKYKDKIAPKDLDYFGFINNNVYTLSEMVDKLLKFSNISEGKNNSFEDVNLNEIVHSATQLLEYSIKNYSAEITIPTELPTINGDKNLLTQLFLNLLNNAIKFSKNALPNPIVTITFKQPHNSQIEISIKDNGVGIPKDHHLAIFDLFRKLNAPKDYEGNGIGLALCKKIIDAHNGKIKVNSEYKNGAEFIFSIGQVCIPQNIETVHFSLSGGFKNN